MYINVRNDETSSISSDNLSNSEDILMTVGTGIPRYNEEDKMQLPRPNNVVNRKLVKCYNYDTNL